MGFFEKRKFRNFLIFVTDYDKNKPSTYLKGKSMDQITTKQLYDEYGLDTNTQAFTGHAMALHRDDDYINRPAAETVEAIQLYADSLERYGKSPYIYPLYGLGGMPEGFSRLCAIHGGTFMLNQGIDEILFDNEGSAWGVKSGNQVRKFINKFVLILMTYVCRSRKRRSLLEIHLTSLLRSQGLLVRWCALSVF
jgi:Rab GDP dissociation inhibitor